MIKITLKYGEKEKKILAPEQKTVRDILKDAEIDFSEEDRIFAGNRQLSEDQMDRNLFELGHGDSSELTIRIEYDLPWEVADTDTWDDSNTSMVHPPKALVIGSACIIFSALTPEDIRDFQRYLPEALVQRDESGEPVFAISLDEKSPGSLNQYGAVFSKRTNSDGNATITILIDPECEDPKKTVREQLGSALISLVEMEEKLMRKLKDLQEKKGILDLYISTGSGA